MSLHKLTAGSGYDYLTRQVAAQDTTELGGATLASYYTEKGEIPGRWIGSGMAGIDGLDEGDLVTQEQMQALFAYGLHPLANLQHDIVNGEHGPAAKRLGTPFIVHRNDVPPFIVDVARRIEEYNVSRGHERAARVSLDDQARIRSEVAREYFLSEHGRSPRDARELASTIASLSRPRTAAVAGFDLTFSPVKSVSALWAVAEPPLAARIERAHNAAVRDALAFIEREALFTRRGARGVRQVEVTGLVAAAFTHRDSRARDPDLHTHVAVANKVQAKEDGAWLAIDGRVLFKSAVAASEAYNTALEHHLSSDLGIRFAERPGSDPRKRPVREIVGVDPRLNDRWSTRRHLIEDRRDELLTDFQRTHGRPPTPVEAIRLAQTATLETREGKHLPRGLSEQRAAWAREAREVVGDERSLQRMVAGCMNPDSPARARIDGAWIASAAQEIVDQVQQRRATWQTWHLAAEAQRRIRGTDLEPVHIAAAVHLLVAEAAGLSVLVASDRDPVEDPVELLRSDGTSVYQVAGSDLFTSQRIIHAEETIVAAGARTDGRRISSDDVDLALMESTANGVSLNAGQASMVRGMATSGRRVQLAIAPAGAGKTTAMAVLTRAWTESGGTIIGLAPSAAAAAALLDQTGTTTDTLAKLVDSLSAEEGQLRDSIGPETLVIIDEAGMADTLTLRAVIEFALQRGASVRLVGDDQQLAAIGCGGVLRDLEDQHGALRIAELLRFEDPAEAAATLALRDGRPEALGFYVDNDRIHIGDQATLIEQVFTAWNADRALGQDSIMLAPTRDLVGELNARARAARVGRGEVDRSMSVRLSDGNRASIGDVVITRRNDRRLRVSETDWVKNGDRWVVAGPHSRGIVVSHVETGLRVVLPPDYVMTHLELGYATTVHTAQGVSVDTMHGIVTGDEARQQFYTMMTRGRSGNHAYLITASDGDPHSLIQPETVHPLTAADMLEALLRRDGSPKSATTMRRADTDARVQLGRAATRYLDAVHQGAERLIGPERVAGLERHAEVALPGVTDEFAWPVLRAHLIMLEAQGSDAALAFDATIAGRDLTGARDRAALIDWRLDPTRMRDAESGPLPWLPAIPSELNADPSWGPYLRARATLVVGCAERVVVDSGTRELPRWARQGFAHPPASLVADIEVWRAANEVDQGEPRPTGPRVLQKAALRHQKSLDDRLGAGHSPALAEWGPLIDSLAPRRDEFAPVLAERLAAISRAGVDARALITQAVAERDLPDEHATAAIWWRIARHLSPTVAAEQAAHDERITTAWRDRLHEHVGAVRTAEFTDSPWWPTLVAATDQALERGWTIDALLDLVGSTPDEVDIDPAQALVWRIAIVTDPPSDEPEPPLNEAPADLDVSPTPGHPNEPSRDPLTVAAWHRELLGPLETTDDEIGRQLDRAWERKTSPVPVARLQEILELATMYYEDNLASSWAASYFQTRLGVDIGADDRFRPGYAPAGWDNLARHLRGQGVSNDELLAAGLVKFAANERMIDRFRDRAVLPIIADGQPVGFVGRRNPASRDEKAGPKYLNSPDTVLFHKGDQLYGVARPEVASGSIPVLVEGPLDAIAVTVATAGAYVGVAPLGTALTQIQAAQFADLGEEPIIATDGDLAGLLAAERDYWSLAPHLVQPRFARFEPSDDPASLLEREGSIALASALYRARPLVETLFKERVAHAPRLGDATASVGAVIASGPPATWDDAISHAALALGLPRPELASAVSSAAEEYNQDRRAFCADQLSPVAATRSRLETSTSAQPAERWAALGRQLDARLVAQSDWPATAEMLQELADAELDVATITREAIAGQRLDDQTPAQDLRQRLAPYLIEACESTPEQTNPASDHVLRGRASHDASPSPHRAGPPL